MKLFTAAQQRALEDNGRWNATRLENTTDFRPVVKLFCPWGAATWLLTELAPDNPDIAFGLCDLGMGSPELGDVSIPELLSLRGPGGLRIERDRHFRAEHTLSEYAAKARETGWVSA